MKSITLNPIALWAAILTGSLIIGLGIQLVQAWTAPTQTAPNGNVQGPITLGGGQTKQGGLTLNAGSLSTYGLVVPNGNVGIGTAAPQTKLDVNGAIRLGGTSATCNSAIAGAQRYNSADKDMEICDGSEWKKMGGSGSGDICTQLGGTMVDGVCSNFVGQTSIALINTTAAGGTLTHRNGVPGAIIAITSTNSPGNYDVKVPSDFGRPATRGGRCDFDNGWQLVGCFSGKAGDDVDLLPYSETKIVGGVSKVQVTGCATNDTAAILTIQCSKNL